LLGELKKKENKNERNKESKENEMQIRKNALNFTSNVLSVNYVV
jgi:hypothetical protein